MSEGQYVYWVTLRTVVIEEAAETLIADSRQEAIDILKLKLKEGLVPQNRLVTEQKVHAHVQCSGKNNRKEAS